MSGWDLSNCANHPDRIAIERCEVCNKPLCAYCLYYTEDGQRLCAQHAEQARVAGFKVEEPGAYAEQLIGAQVGVFRKQKRDWTEEANLYKGNSHDLYSLIGMLIGVISVAACCGGVYCLPLVGLFLSIAALINAKKAYDPSRTRKLGLVGLLISGAWVAMIAACILVYGISTRRIITSFQNPNWYQQFIPTDTPSPTPTDAQTSTPTEDLSNASLEIKTPVPTSRP